MQFVFTQSCRGLRLPIVIHGPLYYIKDFVHSTSMFKKKLSDKRIYGIYQ